MSSEIAVGDIVFAHSNGIMGRAIRFGERLRWREKASYWNHAAIVSRINADGTVYVIQAEPRGITDDKPLSSLGEVTLMKLPSDTDVNKVMAFAHEQVGSHYSFLSIASCLFDIASPNWFPSVRRPHSWICSALVAESLRSGGWINNWGDIYTVTPAQLWRALIAEKVRAIKNKRA
jgi:hypothetical protein